MYINILWMARTGYFSRKLCNHPGIHGDSNLAILELETRKIIRHGSNESLVCWIQNNFSFFFCQVVFGWIVKGTRGNAENIWKIRLTQLHMVFGQSCICMSSILSPNILIQSTSKIYEASSRASGFPNLYCGEIYFRILL